MAKTASTISFKAKLHRPSGVDKGAPWTFLNLPDDASKQLPTRSMFSVEGTFNGFPFVATLKPDGQGGHWLQVDEDLREGAGAKAGDVIELEIAPVAVEPEGDVGGHHASRSPRLDLLDRLGEEGGDSREADRGGDLEDDRGEPATVLLRSVGHVRQEPKLPNRR
jgi:hypothetical protein